MSVPIPDTTGLWLIDDGSEHGAPVLVHDPTGDGLQFSYGGNASNTDLAGYVWRGRLIDASTAEVLGRQLDAALATRAVTDLHAAAFVKCASFGEQPGQALFNALRDQAPDLAEELRGSEADPFHARPGTAVMRAAMEWIAARLPAHEGEVSS